MKKFMLLAMLFIGSFALMACVDDDDITDDPTIEIIFWHAWGTGNQALVEDMFASFKAAYPDLDVELNQVGQGGFTDLRNSVTYAIAAGNTPTMIIGYPDHFAGYIAGNALRPLDDFIEHPDHGVDLSDFIEGFINENAQFGDNIFSMPLAKSTEMVVYNKTVFDHWKTELGVAFTHPNELDRAPTWDDLDAWADVIVGDGLMQCEYLFNADSAANFFINSSRQFGAGYTNEDGEILVDNPTTEAMLQFFKDRFETDTLVLPIEWSQLYGSTPFIEGDVCMSQGSTAGTSYNIPDSDNAVAGNFGLLDGVFDLGIMPVVQVENCPTDPTLDPEDINPRCSTMQQGPNIAISADATEAEALAAWLFIRYMVSAEMTTFFAMETGYVPVRISAFNSTDYQDFLATTDPDEIPFAMAANVAQQQVNFYRFDPAFIGPVTSSRARDEVGNAIEALYANPVSHVMDLLRDRLNLD